MESALGGTRVGAISLWTGDADFAPMSHGGLTGGPATVETGAVGGTQRLAGHGLDSDIGSPEAQDGAADTYSVDEDGVLTVLVGDGVLANDGADPGSTASVDTDPAHGALTLNPDGSFTYTPDPDYFGPDSFTYVVVTGGVPSGPATVTLTVNAVNDAPILDLDTFEPGNDAAVSFTEGDAPLLIAFSAVLTDDNDSFDGATLTIAFTANGSTDDQLTINDMGSGPGLLGVSGSDITYDGNVVGSFTGGDNGNALVITFNSVACHCAVQLAMDNIAFFNASDAIDLNARTVSFTLVDGGGVANSGFDTGSADVTISMFASNDSPYVAIDAPIVAVGGETLVNTTTAGGQQDPQIAALTGGGYVVIWSANAADLSDTAITAQLYAGDGTPVGSEFVIDTLGSFDFTHVSVSGLPGGGFVVAWQDVAPGLGRYVAAQRFDALGDPEGPAVPVTAPGAGGFPAVTALDNGGYVVTWLTDDGDGIGVHAQLYDSSDATVGSPFIVNGTITGTQTLQAVASLTDGGFVVTWTSFNTDSNFTEVFARRFDSTGAPVGGEFLVPTSSPTGDQSDATVTGLSNGGFVISWTQAPTFSNVNVHAQLYDADGNPVGSEFAVNTPSAARQGTSSVTALDDGGFVITWKSGDSSGVGDIYSHRYDSSGAEVGGEVRVTDPSRERYEPVVAGLADGGFAIAWTSMGQDGGGAGIYAQTYGPTLQATEQVPFDLKGSITIGDVDSGPDIITVTLSVTEGVLAIDPGTSGVSVDDSDPQSIVLTGTLAEIQALLGSDPTSTVTYTYDDDYLPLGTIELDVTIDDGTDSATDTVMIDVTPVNDAADLDLDFFASGNNATAIYEAGDAPVYLAYDAFFDDDNADWDGATFTIAISNPTSDDQITIESIGTGSGELSLSGSNVLYEGDIVGTWSGGNDGSPLVVTFNADACACAIELLAGSILYENTATTFPAGARTVTFTFVDGDGTANGGSDTATATVALNLTYPATPPVVDAGAAAVGDEDTPIALTGITITDDGDPVTGLVTVLLSVEHGTISILTNVPGGIDSSNIVNGASGRGITIIATPAQINATLAAAGGLVYLGDADFNGADALSITANDGTPANGVAFSSLGALPVGAQPSAIALYDVDGDGLDDIVFGIAGDGVDPGGIVVFANSPYGAALTAGSPQSFVFGDYDGDGTVDIGFAGRTDDSSAFVAYLSSITGDIVTIATVPYAYGLVTADFDGNGLLDFAAVASQNGHLAIILQTAVGVFAAPVFTPDSVWTSYDVAAGDFNGDGVVDLLKGNNGGLTGPGIVDLFIGNGDGTFAASTQVSNTPGNVRDVVTGDFNNDGFLDFAISTTKNGAFTSIGGVYVALGHGDGSFDPLVSYITSAGGFASGLVVGDLNGDGIDDLLVTNGETDGLFSVLIGNGDGSFQAPVDFETDDDPLLATLGDPDGDGDLDVIVGALSGSFEAFNNDGYHRGDGGVKAITVNAVNEVPTGTSSTITAIEDTYRLLSAADLGFSDADGTFASVTINSVSGGSIYYDADGSAGAGVPVEATMPQTYTAQDLIDGKVSYRAAANANGAALGSINFRVTDNGGTSAVSSNTLTVDVTSVPDAPIAQPDAVTTAENVVGTGNLFANNGSGVDSDGDGDAFTVAQVNGSSANVGVQITLASGAKLTVNADGTYSYDPSGKFVTLTDGTSGAVNTSAPDTFTYMVSGGNTVTVTMTVTGVAGPGDRLAGNGGNNVITGTAGGDFFIDIAGGNEDLHGMGGNDVFLFAGTLTSADQVDGGTGTDQIAIQGDYSTQLTLGTGLIGLESLAILPGFDTRFGDPGTNFYDYNIKTVDENVAAGVSFIVDANRLRSGEDFTFDGSAETDGSFFIYGGGGTDTLTGGAMNDAFYFGESNQFGASDTVFGGGGTDQLGLRGDYTITFGANQLNSIENIGMVSALDTRFGILGESYDYNLTMNNGNVAAGQQMTVDAAALRANETLTFNGSAELDGSFMVFGGAGNDVITGSAGDDILSGRGNGDTLTGGLGNDTFRYYLATDSNPVERDGIQDFALGDRIDLSRIDANSTLGGDQAFSFIGNGAFGNHAGELRYESIAGPIWLVQGDIDGDGIADFEVVVVVTDAHVFTDGDFVL